MKAVKNRTHRASTSVRHTRTQSRPANSGRNAKLPGSLALRPFFCQPDQTVGSKSHASRLSSWRAALAQADRPVDDIGL
jgi:hypothetical protein